MLLVDVVGTAVVLSGPTTVIAELRALLADLTRAGEVAPTTRVRTIALEADAGGRYRLRDGDHTVLGGIELALAAPTVVWHLNAIAASTRGHLVLHAGCVAGNRPGDGAVLLPGRSGTGKSTLVAACVRVGLQYLGDEHALLRLADPTMVPYPKPIGLDGEALVPASRLRAGSVGGATPPAAIVFPRFQPGASTAVTRLDAGWALSALAAHTTNLADLRGAALPWLAGLATACPAWQVTYGDAAAVASTVQDVAGPASTVRPGTVIGPVTPTTTTVVVGDELAVFDEPTGQVHLLNATTAFVWTCVPDVDDVRRLAEVASARAPGSSLDPAAAAATVRQLTDVRLLPRPGAPVETRGAPGSVRGQ